MDLPNLFIFKYSNLYHDYKLSVNIYLIYKKSQLDITV